MPIERFATHRHLKLIKRILHHKVCVQLIDFVHDHLHVASHGIREQQEFGARQRLETRQPELFCFQVFQT